MKKLLSYFLLISIAASCSSLSVPTSPPDSNIDAIEIVQGFPKVMPSGSSRFKESQLFFVHADQASEFAVGLLVPIPFVTDIVVDYNKYGTASRYEKKMQELSIFDITIDALGRSQVLHADVGEARLYPIIFIEECYDGVYRLSLTYQVEMNDWFNRYYYHLPTTIAVDDIADPPLAVMDRIRDDLHLGAEKLFDIISRDIQGKFQGKKQLATIGSLYIVGEKVSGITSPKFVRYKNVEILAQENDSYLLKIPGDPKARAKDGGMAFGVHYFNKIQLHTFELE